MRRTIRTAGTRAVLAVLAAVLLWLAWPAPPPAPAPAARLNAVQRSTPPPARFGSPERAPVAAAVVPLARAEATSADARCIVEPARAPDRSGADGVDPTPPVDAALLAARRRIESNLRASPDPYANAVAVWLDVPPGDDADGRLAAERRRRLAALAASTRDPRLYALALRACWRPAGDGCASLNPRQWAALDPGNAMPWTLLMDEAAAHDDLSGLQEALFHVTTSSRIDERDEAPVAAIIDAAQDDDANLAAALAMSTDAIGISAAQVGPVALGACRYASPADANIYQQCLAMRDLLENRSDSTVLRLIGAGIDRRLTGDAAPGQRLAARLARWNERLAPSSTGCADLRAKLGWLRRLAVDGRFEVPDEAPR
jgi:hypothetical protein